MADNASRPSDDELLSIEREQCHAVWELATRIFAVESGGELVGPVVKLRALAEHWAVENREDLNSMNPTTFAVGVQKICQYLFEGPENSSGRMFSKLFFGVDFFPWMFSGTYESTWQIIGDPSFYKQITFNPNRGETRVLDFKFSGTRASSHSSSVQATANGTKNHSTESHSIRLPSGGWGQVTTTSQRLDTNTQLKIHILLTPSPNTVDKAERLGAKIIKLPREVSACQYILPFVLPSGASNPNIQSLDVQDHASDVAITWQIGAISTIYDCQVTTCEPSILLKAISNNEAFEMQIGEEMLEVLISEAISRKLKRQSNDIALVIDAGFCLPPNDLLWRLFTKRIRELKPSYQDIWLITRIQGMVLKFGWDEPKSIFLHQYRSDTTESPSENGVSSRSELMLILQPPFSSQPYLAEH